jgi:DNA-directed RNA polymerase subunit RPC12/RpoP
MNETFPPPGFISAESAIPGIVVYAPAPEETEALPEVSDFKCPQCQATTAYSVADGGLRCAHCGYYEPPAKPIVGKGAQEFEFTVETMAVASQAHGWGETRQELQCQNCNARATLPPGRLTYTCPFCGSNRVLQQDAPQDTLRPRFLIPFKIEADACGPIAQKWLGSSWMVPKSLKQSAVAGFTGIYLPYWTFDAVTKAEWRAEVGHQETRRRYNSSTKSWESHTVTVWRWESGSVRKFFDDLLVPGTARLSHVLLSNLQNYDTQALVAYEPQYLAGFMAQAYDVQLEKAWEESREKMRAATCAACRGQASTSQIRNFSMTLDFSEESWRYVLAPVYMTVYQYEDQPYQVMINGQTGAIAGQRPVDWHKVWLVVGAIVAPGALLSLLGLIAILLGVLVPPALGAAAVLLVPGIILLIIGGIIAFIILGKAGRMGDV